MNQKGFVNIIIAVIVVVVLAGGVGYFVLQQKAAPVEEEQPEALAPSSLKLLSPNGNELWKLGETRVIEWESTSLPDNELVTLTIFSDGKEAPLPVSDPTEAPLLIAETPNSGSYTWDIPDGFEGSTKVGEKILKICVSNLAISAETAVWDCSDGLFTISS